MGLLIILHSLFFIEFLKKNKFIFNNKYKPSRLGRGLVFNSLLLFNLIISPRTFDKRPSKRKPFLYCPISFRFLLTLYLIWLVILILNCWLRNGSEWPEPNWSAFISLTTSLMTKIFIYPSYIGKNSTNSLVHWSFCQPFGVWLDFGLLIIKKSIRLHCLLLLFHELTCVRSWTWRQFPSLFPVFQAFPLWYIYTLKR